MNTLPNDGVSTGSCHSVRSFKVVNASNEEQKLELALALALVLAFEMQKRDRKVTIHEHLTLSRFAVRVVNASNEAQKLESALALALVFEMQKRDSKVTINEHLTQRVAMPGPAGTRCKMSGRHV